MIVILEDEKRHGHNIGKLFLSSSIADDVRICSSLHEFYSLIKSSTPELIFAELEFTDGSVFDLLREFSHIPLAVVTAHGSEELAVRAIKAGAKDYFVNRNGCLWSAEELVEKLRVEGAGQESLHIEIKKQILFIEALLSAIPTPVFFKDRNGYYIGCNRAFTEVMGMTTEQVAGKAVYELWPGDQASIYHQKDLELINKQERQIYDFFVTDKNGKIRDVIFAKDVFFDAGGEVAGIVGAFLDISERKQIEKNLVSREAMYRSLISEMQQGLALHEVVCDVDGAVIDYRFLEVNESFERLTGLQKDDIIGKTVLEVLPQTEKLWIENYGRVALSGEPMHFESYSQEIGKYFEVTAYRPAPKQFAVIITDITERRQMELDLYDSEKKLSATLNSIGDGVIATDTNGLITRMNSVAERLTAWSEKDALGRSLYDVFHIFNARSGKPTLNPVKKAIATGKIQGLANHTVLQARDGCKYHIADSAAPIFDRFEHLLGVVLVFRDVSTEYEMRDSLERERAQLLAIFDSISESICVTDIETHEIIYVNRAMKRIFGHNLIGGRCYRDILGRDSSCTHCQKLSSRKNRYEAHHWDYHNKVVDKYFHAIDRLIQWPDGREVRFHMAIDISNQKRAEKEKAILEQQFNHAQKMESVGRLAGGMAHDLNNLLTPILCYGELLSIGLSHDQEMQDSAEEILKAGLRARDLVQQLLAFSRKQVLRFEAIELNREVNILVRLLRRTIPENVDIRIYLYPEQLLMRGDCAQIEQVLMNLVVNAWDAMPDGGILTIETRLTELDQGYVDVHREVNPGKYVVLEVSDSGTGMSPETREKIFEPFFSTKEKGKGTGLGLATTYGIVKQHGGHIWVYSELNRGTSFKLYFPFVSEKPEVRPENDKYLKRFIEPSAIAVGQSRGTILLVEDSEAVRKLSTDVLKKAGYNVLVAEDGQQALLILDGCDEKIDLLLTDVIMPRMNGRQLFSALRPLYPELKVIYMSGYTENVIAQHGVLDEGMFFIQKPFSVKILSDMVAKVFAS